MGLDQNFFDQGWVSYFFVWKISTKNSKFLNFFPIELKGIFLGLGQKYPGQRLAGYLITLG